MSGQLTLLPTTARSYGARVVATAVSVTACPTTEGFADEVIVTAVDAGLTAWPWPVWLVRNVAEPP